MRDVNTRNFTGLILLISCVLLAPLSAGAAHTLDTSQVNTGMTGSPSTFNYTCGSGTTVIVLHLTIVGNTARTGGAPTYNGVAMTQADSVRTATETNVEMWYLVDPPTGAAYTVSIPNTGGRTIHALTSSAKAQAGFTSALDIANGTTGTTANPSLTVNTSVNGDFVTSVCGHGGNAVGTGNKTQYGGVWGTDHGAYVSMRMYELQAASGNTTHTFTAAADDWALIVAAFKEVAAVVRTTVGNGTNPGAASLCPGGAATSIDAFTLQTNTGTDTVTAVQVDFAAGTNAGVGLIEVLNEVGTVCGSATNPTDPQNINLSTTIGTSTTSKTCSLRITPRTHANMPAVPGASYAVTAVVSDITVTNQKTLNDTASATVTIDNLSPNNATWGTITPGDTTVDLAWTNPGGDFSEVVILRSGSAISDAPTEGNSYSQGNTIGASTVRYVGALTAFQDTGLTNGQNYYYKIFSKDTCGNYAAGAQTGPHQPQAITLTVGNGTNPADSAKCPGDTAAMMDAFTLQTSSGNDTVTSVTVTFAAGTAAGLSLVEVTNDGGGTVYGSQANPSDTQAVALSTNITATTTLTQYKVRVTPKSHAAMPAPPGSTYSVSGRVTALASSRTKVYNDSSSGTVTIDNSSPSNATWGTITPGDTQVVLNWTNPGDADFSEVVILRSTSTISDAPTEGQTYIQGNTIGSSTVRYAGALQTFTDTGLTNGQNYYYKIFSKDTCGNYSAGSQTGPHQPNATTTTVGDGTNPGNASVCPGGTAQMMDAFTLQTSTGTDTVTSVTVSFAAGTAAGLSLVEITNDGGGTVYGSQANPSDTQAVALTTNITANSTLTQYKVRVTPKSHATMPAPPGSSYAVSGTVTLIASSNSKSYSDSSSSTVTVDNLSTSNPAWGSVTPGDTQVSLSWSNPADSDFSQTVILRSTSSITDVPTEGQGYTPGNVIGSCTVIYAGGGTSFLDTGLTNGQPYYYKAFGKDACGNYSAGTEYGPVTPTTGGGGSTSTKAETASASVSSCNTIVVRAPFLLDSNSNSTTTVRRGPASTGPWTLVCNAISGASPRVCLDSGLTGGQVYYYQVTVNDADGVLGTNPQVIGPYTTPVCVSGSTTVTSVTASVSACKQITVEAHFTGDSNNNGSVQVQWSPAGAGSWTTSCSTVKGPSPRRCLVTGLSASTAYDIRVTFTDPDGVAGTNPTTVSSISTGACGADQDPATLMFLSPAKGAIIGGTEKIKVQVYDAGGLRAVNPVEYQVDGGAWSTTGVAVNGNYSCGASCSVFQFDLNTTALAAGSHTVGVRATDLQNNVAVESISFTVNNRGTNPGGSGALLRRTEGSQLCIDCHALETHSSQNTSTKYGNWAIDCLGCHTPHRTTSLYLVRDTITTPSSGDKNIVFRVDDRSGGTNPQNSYLGAYDASGLPYDDGVCEACHTKTNHYRNDNSGGDHDHSQATRCVSCHKHSEGFKGAGCDGCHRSPPTTGKHGAHWQLAATGGSYSSTTLLSTATEYGYTCVKCHSGTHTNDTHTGAIGDPYRVEVAFDNTADPKNPTGAYSQKYPDATDQGTDSTKYWSWTSSVAGSDGNCANTYCHSNASPLGGTNLNQTPKWNQAAALGCNGCHNTAARGDSGTATDLSNAHGKHIQSGAGETNTYSFKCDECHSQVVRDNPNSPWALADIDMANKANHAVGTHTVNFSSTSVVNNMDQSGGVYAGGSYTCTGTYCHSLGTSTTSPFSTPNNNALAWNQSATCTSCHSGDASQASKIGTTNGSATHAPHINNLTGSGGVLGVNLVCSDCHNTVVSGNTSITAGGYALHVNGFRNVSMTTGSYASPNCTNSYCHSSGQSTAEYYSMAWGGAAIDCKGCHGRHSTNAFVSAAGEPNYTNGGAGQPTANSHQKHVSAATDCADCHNDTTVTGTAILLGATIHADGVRQVAIAAAWDTNGGTKSDNYNAGTKTCSSIKCHGSGTPQWGASNLGCSSCHGGAVDVNNWNISDGTASVISTTEWTSVGHGQGAIGLGGANNCLYCHEDGVNHGVGTNPFRLNGATTDAVALPGAFNAAASNGNAVCLNCHGTGSFGVDPDGASGGYAKVNGTSKIDSWHYGADHLATQDGGSRCWDCHDGHGDGSNIMMIGSDTLRDGADVYGLTGTRSTTAAVFTANAAATDYAKTAAPFNGICQVCHTTTNHWRADGTLITHQTAVKCTSCHQHDNAATNLAFTAPSTCNSCHNAPPTGGKHSQHIEVGTLPTDYTNTTNAATATQYEYACGQCHTTVLSNHMDDIGGTVADPYNVDVDFAWDTQTYTQGGTTTTETHATSGLVFKSTNGSCTNVYCHDPQGAVYNANTAVTWTTAGPLSCTGCHDDGTGQATTLLPNAHTKHITNAAGAYSYGCEKCHSNTTTTGNTITNNIQHADNSKDVRFNALPLDQSAGTFTGGVAGTCSNTYCHSNGQDRTAPFTSGPSIAWNTTVAADCSSCHGGNASAAVKMGPSNDHAAHMDQAGYLGTNTPCGDCHNSTVSPANDRAITTLASHVNGSAEVNMVHGGTYSGPGTKQCSNTYCHSDGTETPGNFTTMDWDLGTSLANDCKQCHGKAGGAFVSVAGEPNYTERVTTSDDVRNSHSKHVSGASDCVKCHSSTVTAGGALISGGTLHLNQVGNVQQGGTATFTYNATGETCSTISCHGGNSASWGGAALICTNCHGGAADLNNWNISDGTISIINTGTEWTTYGHGSAAVGFAGANICLYCHDDAVNHTVSTNPFRLRGAANASGVTGAYNALSATNGNDICINCHDADAGTRFGVDPDGASGGYALKKAATSFVDAWHYGGKHAGTDGGKRCWDCHDVHGDLTNIFMIGADTLSAGTDDYGLTGTRSAENAIFTSGAAGGYTKASTPYTGVCQVCHTQTSYWLANGTVQTHNSGTDCTLSCHIHQQPPNFAFKGAGTCMDCHKSRTGTAPNQRYIITGGTAGSEGDDFIRASRHVSNGTATSIVTNFDCILCHAEGDVTSSGTNIKTVASSHGGDSGGTKTVDLRNVDSSGGTGIMVAWPGWRNPGVTPAPTITTANRDGMDSFCMGCHDANGASNVAVNAANTGLDTSTTGAAARRLTPFNTADTIRNSKESGTIATSRTRVIDVKSQFNSTNQVGKAWASHHNLNQFTKRYTARNTTHWPNAAWTTYTTKEGQNIQTAGEVAGLHCSDCHLNEVNAHGTRNTWYMLSDMNGNDTAFTNVGYTTSTDICSKCHARTTYGMGNTDGTNSRTDAHNGAGARCDNIAWDNEPGFAYLGFDSVGQDNHLSCLGCHGGLAPGMIHGTNDTYEPWDTTPDGTGVTKRFRFMGTGGSMRWYSPNGAAFATNTPASDTNWEGTSTFGCYTISAADTYGACTNHGTGRSGSAPNRARPLQY